MTSFTVSCACGERFHADEGSIGRRARCRCGRTVELQPPPNIVLPAAKRTSHRSARRTSGRAVRVLRFLAWCYLAAIVAVAAVMWGLGDRWWPATVLLFMGRWVFLLPLILLVPASLALRRRLLLPLSLGAVVALGPVMGGRVGWARPFAPSGGMPLRVVTFNADGGSFLASNLPRLLQEWGADVVLFQECGEQLAAATERVPAWHWHHVSDLCMLTPLPILAADVMDRSSLANVRRDEGPTIGGAGYVARYTLGTPNGPIHVTNLHLETPRKGFEGFMAGDVQVLRLNTTLRDLESELARRWVDGGHAPTIVAGDFNTPVESRIFEEHWGDLADAFSRVGFGLGTTKYNGWIRIRIDHVLTDDAWRPRAVQVWTDLGSDHRPLVADLVLVKH
ncbi:MAG TPA: endonuclease/exonuclease/phosphatase family protein [Gemmatimonadaceae bacterium]